MRSAVPVSFLLGALAATAAAAPNRQDGQRNGWGGRGWGWGRGGRNRNWNGNWQGWKSDSPVLTSPGEPSVVPITDEPTIVEPTIVEPTIVEPTIVEPTIVEPTIVEPTIVEPTIVEPTIAEPTTAEPTTAEPTTAEPTTAEPTTAEPTTAEPTTISTSVDPTTTSTPSTSSTASETSSGVITHPTAKYTAFAVRDGSPIHNLPMVASGLQFWLSGDPALYYCPDSIRRTGGCPEGNATIFAGTCSMSVIVPGGQQTWATPDGAVGYTQAHSISSPLDSMPCAFDYRKEVGEEFGHLIPGWFGATGLMACPTEDDDGWLVFAALQNATVPKGDVSTCLEFDALTVDYDGPGVWQY